MAAAAWLRQILQEGKDEVVTGAHASRWGGERVAAGVKRARGGAIVVTVDATEIAALEKPASLESLLAEITAGSPEIAYTVFEHADARIAFGDAPADAPGRRRRAVAQRERPPGPRVRERRAARGRRDGAPAPGHAPRQRAARRAAHGPAPRSPRWPRRPRLVAFAFGLAGLRRRYGVLSEKHARAEEALRRRDRLAAMGELASTVAHEVRNPLNAVA